MDMNQFLKYFTSYGLLDGYDKPVTDAERQLLAERYPEFWQGNVSSHHYDEVDQLLRAYYGVTLEELLNINEVSYPYLEEYDRFYVNTSDVGGSAFVCVSGGVYDGFVKLYSENAVLTLVERDGSYYFYSYTGK